MKITKVANGTLYENNTLIPQGVYSGTQLTTLQPGEHLFVPDIAAPEGDLGAVAAYAADAYEKD